MEKQRIYDAVKILKDKDFIDVKYLKFSDDIKQIYLVEENLDDLYKYLKDEYGVVP